MTTPITTADIRRIVKSLRYPKPPRLCYFCRQPFGPWPYQVDALWFLADDPKTFLGELCKPCNWALKHTSSPVTYYD